MGRRKLTDPPTHTSCNIPQSVALRLDLEFFSEVEGRQKAGKSELIAGLLRSYFDEKDGNRKSYEALEEVAFLRGEGIAKIIHIARNQSLLEPGSELMSITVDQLLELERLL